MKKKMAFLGVLVLLISVGCIQKTKKKDVLADILNRTRKVTVYSEDRPLWVGTCVIIDKNTALTAGHVVDINFIDLPNISIVIDGCGKVINYEMIGNDQARITFEIPQNIEPVSFASQEDLILCADVFIGGCTNIFDIGDNIEISFDKGTIADPNVAIEPGAIVIAASGGPGLSGGGVWTLDGKLIGIVTSGKIGTGFIIAIKVF